MAFLCDTFSVEEFPHFTNTFWLVYSYSKIKKIKKYSQTFLQQPPLGPDKSVRWKRYLIKLRLRLVVDESNWPLLTGGHYSQLVVKQVILFLFSCKINHVLVWHIEFLNFFYKNENLSWIRLELCTYQSVKFGKIWNLKKAFIIYLIFSKKLLKSGKTFERSAPLFDQY